MTAPIIYGMAPVKLNSTVLAATDFRLPTGIVEQAYQHSGYSFPSVEAVSSAIPRISFKTPLAAALNLIGTTTLALTTFEIYLTKFSASTYVKAGAASNPKWASSSGMAYITDWSVGQNGIALATVEVCPFSSDGSSHPLTRTDSTTIPTLSSEPQLHTLGPLSVNGSVITGLNSVTVNMGHVLDVRVSDGDLYPRTAALLAGTPTISGEHLDPPTLLSSINLIGASMSGNVIAYYKSFDTTTQLVSTANAVSATMASGRIMVTDMPGDQNRMQRCNILCRPLSSSSSHPIAISTSATAPST